MIAVHPLAIGVIANPSSGRDLRRLFSWGSTFSMAEKINAVLRLLSSAGALGIQEAWLMPDTSGLAREVQSRAQQARLCQPAMPEVRLLDLALTDSAGDSTRAAALMAERGVRAIAVLGGDGTHRAVARGCGEVPLATLSTGTNNAFPERFDATLAGMAAALVATGRIGEDVGVRRNKRLLVRGRGLEDMALVDIAVSRQDATGAGAVDCAQDLQELFVSFCEPGVIGLASVAALLEPTSRDCAHGLHLRMELGAPCSVQAPLMPGLVAEVGVGSLARLQPGVPVAIAATRGTLALDGERSIEIAAHAPLAVALDAHGPRSIMVEAVLRQAARANRLPLG
ncbi:MAG: NAD(+)/NADH kinase [Acidovorax sp.]|nr:NAD(+)/NADH kinase [Acidovorax sp.]